MSGVAAIRKSNGGFTLIELLVVVVLVMAVSALSFSAWQTASRAGRKAVCMGNLRNIGVAFHLHAQENSGMLPLTTHSTTVDRAWIYALEEHLGKFDETRICPADPKGRERLALKGSSYILNSFVFVPSVDAFGRPRGKVMNRLSNLDNPSATMLTVVCSDDVGTAPGNDHTHSERWTSWAAVRRDNAVDRHGARSATGLNGGSNYLYADASVRFIPAGEIKGMIDVGINPAQPPGWTP